VLPSIVRQQSTNAPPLAYRLPPLPDLGAVFECSGSLTEPLDVRASELMLDGTPGLPDGNPREP